MFYHYFDLPAFVFLEIILDEFKNAADLESTVYPEDLEQIKQSDPLV